jgi:glycosyltransferase involved in cell wall biosynthesis
LRQLLAGGQFDIVHVDSLDLLAYMGALEGYPIVLVHHNVESSLLLRRADEVGVLEGTYLRLQARLVGRAERKWCRRVDLNVVVSREDEEALKEVSGGGRFVVIPNGVDTKEFVPVNCAKEVDLVFVGGYSWFPNADGMKYFVERILPHIRRSAPGVRVRWIGKAPGAVVEAFQARGIEMTGYVEDIRPYVASSRCAIVPLRVGGGTRLKILDAWAMGMPVVSTARGCEGLAIEPGHNILVGDEPGEFARHVVDTLSSAELRARLGAAGRRTAERVYEWNVLGDLMHDHYGKVSRRKEEEVESGS